jgi:lipoyl(octanoyl) transferase
MKQFILQKEFGLSFDEAMAIQISARKRLIKNRDSEALLLMVEHSPVVTMGRGGSEENLLVGKDGLKSVGVEYVQARRGGDVTYHGPGQITMYPVFPLEWWWRDLHKYMRMLEETTINYLRKFSVEAGRMEEYTGVWIGNEKIAAIGIAVSNWITYYGTAVNIKPDMSHFGLIRPCGIEEKGVTSLFQLRDGEYNISDEMDRLAESFCHTFEGAVIV